MKLDFPLSLVLFLTAVVIARGRLAGAIRVLVSPPILRIASEEKNLMLKNLKLTSTCCSSSL
jgi:hypothetical protein